MGQKDFNEVNNANFKWRNELNYGLHVEFDFNQRPPA